MTPPSKPTSSTSSDTLYLQQLEFKPELRNSFLYFFIHNFRVVILLIFLLTLWGIYSYERLPRESNPEVKIPIAIVTTVYPGASPSDVEEFVTKKLETRIAGLKDIKKITSSSANSFSAITVEFDAKAPIDDSIRKLRDEVKNGQKDLPSEAQESIVKEISLDDTPIWTFSITGPYDGFTLRSFGDHLKDELEKIPGIREVQVSGGDEKEFEIAYDPQKLISFGVSLEQANQMIKATNIAYPSGTFEDEKYSYAVRIDSRFFDVEKIKNIPLFHTADNSLIYLRDVATITEKAIKKTVYSRLSSHGNLPTEAVTLQVIKKTGGSILETVQKGKKTVETLIQSSLPNIRYETISDASRQIERDFDQLTHDFILTILLVFTILFLIVGLKEALVAGLAVPLTFFSSFGVMLLTGTSLNFLSIFSLLLSLGLLVDDAIVVVSATKQYMKTGKFTPEEAVLLVLNVFKVVLTTTTLTTVWAFLPLLMASGIIGSFIKSIPITVSVTLISSLLIALIINHPLAAILERIRLTKKFFFAIVGGLLISVYVISLQQTILSYSIAAFFIVGILLLLRWYSNKGRKILAANKLLTEKEWENDDLIKQKLKDQSDHTQENFWNKLMHGIIHFNAVLPLYEKYLRFVIFHTKTRITILIIVFMLFIGTMTLPAIGIVVTEFFPVTNGDTIYMTIETPPGLKLDETDKIVRLIETKLLDYPDITNFSTIVGKPASNGSRLGTRIANDTSNLAGITINLIEKEKRASKSYNLAAQMRKDFSSIPLAKITINIPAAGPPSGAAFEAQIHGENLQTLDRIAHDFKTVLETIPGIVDTNISLKESPAEYTFVLDPAKLELYNLNAVYVGSILRTAISGIEVTKVLKEGKEIRVQAIFDTHSVPHLEDIQNLQILNVAKQPVFLKDVLQTEVRPSVDTITRINQQRTVLLTAGVDTNTRPGKVLRTFQEKIATYTFPPGYDISYGGENEQNTESVLSVITAMQVAFLLIISTLIIQFNSFKKAFVVLVTIPLALIGVFIGLAITHLPLSFPGLIGILALFGIVVKNAIILIDKINLNLKSGIVFDEAIIDAGKSRLEAIFITSICTIAGLVPITLSNDTWRALGGTVIFGLLLSSFLTLFIVPMLFKTFISPKERF